MKRITNICTLAALLMASAAIVSCSVKEEIFKEETTIEEEPEVQPEEPAKVYTLSVSATKGGDDETTKALSLDGKTLNASWAEGEKVTVYNKTKKALLEGTLTAQSSGASTTLEGSLTGTIENGDVLILRFNSANYASQSGTLDYIAANCDFAEASITVSSVDGENHVIPTSTAIFENQQAIVKFTLQNSGGTSIGAGTFVVQVDDNNYAVIPAEETDVFYVAVPGFNDLDISLFAKVDNSWYSLDRSHVTFTNGQYYSITVKMAQTGTLPGIFSVSNNRKVRFSQGNLRYDVVDDEPLWRFHSTQYDFLGNWTSSRCDLFYWETADNYGAVEYYVWRDRSIYDIVNWGDNPISNGGNVAHQWITLNLDEWNYLLETRTASTVNEIANAHFARGSIGTTIGLFLFPNRYIHPSGLAEPYAINLTDNSVSWESVNTYNVNEWTRMEAAGAVFLPAAGMRQESNIVNSANINGNYWTSDSFYYRSDDANRVLFSSYSNMVMTDYELSRQYGCSVRLVKIVE